MLSLRLQNIGPNEQNANIQYPEADASRRARGGRGGVQAWPSEYTEKYVASRREVEFVEAFVN